MTDSAPASVPDTRPSDPPALAARRKAAMLEMARIVNEAARKERQMWLRALKKLREMGVR